MTKKIYLICGVPGSGKTWVSKQLDGKFHYLPHDANYKNHTHAVWKASQISDKPIITECPFGERELKARLIAHGLDVKPYFVVESPDTVKLRYEDREKRPCPQNHITRASSIGARAKEWQAPHGTSDEVLQLLQKENIDGETNS